MNEHHPDELDGLLRQWADSRAAGEQRTQQLSDRIAESLGEDTFRVLDELAVERNRAVRWRNALAGVSATVALLLLVVLGISFLNRPEPPLSEVTPEFAWLTDQHVEQKKVLWTEFDQTFDHRLTWIAETSDQIEFGLAEGDGLPRANSRPVAVRVVVARRKTGESSWQPVWAADVISHSERIVRLPRKSTGSADLTMWTYVLPDGNVAVDTVLEIDNHKLNHVESSNVQQDREPVSVFSKRIDGAEYQIFQTVAVLNEEVG